MIPADCKGAQPGPGRATPSGISRVMPRFRAFVPIYVALGSPGWAGST